LVSPVDGWTTALRIDLTIMVGVITNARNEETMALCGCENLTDKSYSTVDCAFLNQADTAPDSVMNFSALASWDKLPG